jgi:hypothetical protein
MTFVVAIASFFIWPGTPDIPNKLFLSEAELSLARKRMADNGTGSNINTSNNTAVPKVNLALLKSIITGWKIYTLTFWDILFWNSDPQP